jgi:hypothetical protein
MRAAAEALQLPQLRELAVNCDRHASCCLNSCSASAGMLQVFPCAMCIRSTCIFDGTPQHENVAHPRGCAPLLTRLLVRMGQVPYVQHMWERCRHQAAPLTVVL